MAVSYRDIAPSGLRVLGSAWEDRFEPFVQFAADPLIAIPTETRNLRLARQAEVVAFKGQNDLAYTVTRSGIVTPHGKVAGDQAVALSPSGILAYVIDPGGSRPPTQYSFNGVARPIPTRLVGTSQGIHDVDDEGNVTWGDDRLVPSTFGPLSLIKWTTDGAWTWGTTPWGCGVWNAVTQRAYIAVLDTEMLWTMRGAVVAGQLILARSLPADEIPETRFLPYDPAVTYAPVVRIGRPLWFGFFEFAPALDLPRNCAVPVVQGAPWLDVTGPGWRYVSGASDGAIADIEAAIRTATTGPAPVVAYVPRKAQVHLPTIADIQGIEAYLGVTETDAQFIARMTASILECGRCVLIAQCYTSNTTLTGDLRRLPGLISQLARDHAHVEGILIFSGSGRATGWQDHPEVHAAWRQVFAGITGTPAVIAPVPSDPPSAPIPDPGPQPAPAPPVVPPATEVPTMTQPPYTPPVAHVPPAPRKPNVKKALLDFVRALSRLNFRRAFGGRSPKHQLPLPSPDVPPAPPVVEAPPAPAPIHRPPVAWPQIGLSHYQALGDPDFDWPVFLDFCRTNGVGYHRTWLIDAWATRDIGGLYDGFLPCRRRHDGLFDLFDWRADYFARLRTVTDQSNDRGIFPLWTLLELYSWSTRKGTNPGVPDVGRNLFRANVNGVRWGMPDDLTFGAPPFEGQGLPDEWLRAFTERVLEALSGTSYAIQIGNEFPEKALHHRVIDMLRSLGYAGEIVINRNEDGPGQPYNMGMVGAGGDRYDRHEFHLGTADETHTADYLDIEHPEEAAHGRPTTIRELLGRVDPARIIVSSDGDGGRIVATQAAIAREVLRLGASFERQSNLKRNRFFGDGSLRMSDLHVETPFLNAIRS